MVKTRSTVSLNSLTEPPLIVPDASVVLAYILGETEYKAPVTLLFERAQLGDCQLFSPRLLLDELGNRLSRIHHFSIATITSSLQVYATVELTPPVVARAIQLVRSYSKVTWYDAVYHAVAIEYGGQFVTADRYYYSTTRQEGSIVFISDYSLG